MLLISENKTKVKHYTHFSKLSHLFKNCYQKCLSYSHKLVLNNRPTCADSIPFITCKHKVT